MSHRPPKAGESPATRRQIETSPQVNTRQVIDLIARHASAGLKQRRWETPASARAASPPRAARIETLLRHRKTTTRTSPATRGADKETFRVFNQQDLVSHRPPRATPGRKHVHKKKKWLPS
ncbi:MAG: hypothetical protein R3E58_01335 [Phycisphaerae bacterium]